ncbi:hypothetical protein EVJ58_g2844 [Rhodofomes roseus]|uniref:Transcription activator of gluconeogenesis ERT1 n=1 Tax=Rhodofomes roseus TaxID=34475 RepID=A0A4Y9YQK3_9APHY|nr:hypothetical protein EVJ58_g2844 [Rhodofomes roseus]
MLSSQNSLDDIRNVPTAVAQRPSLPPYHTASASTVSETDPATAVPKKKSTVKRKRTQDGTSDSADSSSQPTRTRDGPKKKKANRACASCQKAHLTCDDARPCQRCVKRGMADQCMEGRRKKAKYLLDAEELEALKRTKSGDGSSIGPEPAPVSQPAPPEPQYAPPDPMYAHYPNQTSFGAGSEGANLEYSILSAILGNSPDSSSQQPAGSPTMNHAAPSAPYGTPPGAPNLVAARWSTDAYGAPSQQPAGYASSAGAGPSNYAEQAQLGIQPSAPSAPIANPALASEYGGYPPGTGFTPGQGEPAVAERPSIPVITHPAVCAVRTADTSGRRVNTRGNASRAWGGLGDSGRLWCRLGAGLGARRVVRGVYQAVTKPYDYTEGYHFLMKHLPMRFEKNDILRIVRALAIFRPSLIALQMPLSEEDEVFVEKCFQRSLIELDKLVSFSGTPTVAWRRTGEICLVGPEFCMLTGWEKDELVGRRKYIYELFENQSVVEYWENFANHAFENTTQSVYSHCVLLKPSGAPVPCTFCFSIKRDIMDLPSLVIGMF